jgi:AcrR family transcriptional regulator
MATAKNALDNDHTEGSESRARVLDAAERLFAERGYRSVTLRDIAAEIGIRHTSLYHHAPGGKEQLFIEVTERSFKHHHDGLVQAVTGAAPDIRSQLHAVADWLLSQAPMDLIRMVYSDMPAIDPKEAARLSRLAYDSMLSPLNELLEAARARGEISHSDLNLAAGGLLGMIESIQSVPVYAVSKSREAMAYGLIDVMLNGLLPR